MKKNEKCMYVLPIFWFLKEGLIDEKRGDRAIKEEGGRQLAGHNNGLGAGALSSYSKSSITGMIGSKNVKKSSYCKFQVHY